MQWGYRVPKTEKNPEGYQLIDFDDIDFTQPVILLFGGNGSLENKNANGYLKIVENLLGLDRQQFIKSYAIKYERMSKNNFLGTVNYDDSQKIINHLDSYFVDKNKNKISVKDAMKIMRNINIISHCKGSEFVNNLFLKFSLDLDAMGYTMAEREKILSQAFHLSYAPFMTSAFKGYNLLTNVLFKNVQDTISGISKQEFFDIFGTEANIPSNIFTKEPNFNGLYKTYVDKHNLIFYLNHTEPINGETNPHGIAEFMKDKDFYVSNNYRQNSISMVMSGILSAAVINSINNFMNLNGKFEELPSLGLLKEIADNNISQEQLGIKENEYKDYLDWHYAKYNNKKQTLQSFMTKHDINERDLINGKVDLKNKNMENIMFKYNINYGKSKLFDDCFIPINKTEWDSFFNSFVLLRSGKIYGKMNLPYMPVSIRLRIANENLKGSVQVNYSKNINGDFVYKVSPNYGAFDDDMEFENMEQLVDFWHQNYDESRIKKDIVLTKMQQKALNKFCDKMDTKLVYDDRISNPLDNSGKIEKDNSLVGKYIIVQ